MSFGFTRPTQGTNSQSNSFGENFASNESHGFNRSNSSSESVDLGTAIWGGQRKFLSDLFRRAQGQSLDNSNLDFATRMLGIGGEGIDRFLNYGQNPELGMYARQIGQEYRENVLPGIRQQSAGINSYGGSRQAIAEGVAGGRAHQQIQDFGAQLYNQDQNRALTALSGIPEMVNMGLGIPWYNMNQYAGLLGSPIVVDRGGYSSSRSSSYGENSASGGSYGYNTSTSNSSGGGGGGGFNIGIGSLGGD